MQFSTEDIDTILEATGEPVVIQFGGVDVKIIRGKFRKNFASISPYESSVGILHPAVICKTSDLADIDNSYVFIIQGKEYKFDGKPEELPNGLTHVKLGAKL